MKKVDEDDTGGINQENIIALYLKELREKREKGQETNMSGKYLKGWELILILLTAGKDVSTTKTLARY